MTSLVSKRPLCILIIALCLFVFLVPRSHDARGVPAAGSLRIACIDLPVLIKHHPLWKEVVSYREKLQAYRLDLVDTEKRLEAAGAGGENVSQNYYRRLEEMLDRIRWNYEAQVTSEVLEKARGLAHYKEELRQKHAMQLKEKEMKLREETAREISIKEEELAHRMDQLRSQMSETYMIQLFNIRIKLELTSGSEERTSRLERERQELKEERQARLEKKRKELDEEFAQFIEKKEEELKSVLEDYDGKLEQEAAKELELRTTEVRRSIDELRENIRRKLAFELERTRSELTPPPSTRVDSLRERINARLQEKAEAQRVKIENITAEKDELKERIRGEVLRQAWLVARDLDYDVVLLNREDTESSCDDNITEQVLERISLTR